MSQITAATMRKLIQAGHDAWLASRDYRGPAQPKPGPKVRCPLVNPLCPDDLCILEADHPGTKEGYHTLGTDPYDNPHRYVGAKRSVMFLHPDGPGVSDWDLTVAGSSFSLQRRQTQ